ncbi:precorrin-6y C5,15-methyltransferase (decarboxylating) subunit CbiE [Cohnella sp.]|uniref:precorrin-6y C5,15-methyltransferase (decarboxylating) subunit CbiE n=1 Tax=Cohnella sp. TaxID=1883426 RepID=UPI00356B48BF
MKPAIKLIGIGDNGKASLLPLYLDWIEQCEVLVGGERHLQFFTDFKGEKRLIKGPLSELIEQLKQEERKIVILASGDPLFYGIGNYATQKLGNVEIYPHVSSVQLAFARLGLAWQDAYVTSVHGRSIKGLAQRIDGRQVIALLTDAANSPSVIAQYLLQYGMNEYRAFVAENLGGSLEKTGWYSLQGMAEAEFSALNVIILQKQFDGPVWSLGIEDDHFLQRKPDKGLITKKEVRVLSIANMNLRPDSIVWDIGTCTGSMAIEAARIARLGQVYAIEKNEADLDNCKQNAVRFRTDITAIHGKAPLGLEQFPDPNSIFIGGTGGEMQELLHVCCSRLQADGVIVLNVVTIENLYEANKAFAEEGFKTQITLQQVSRSKPILDMNRFEGLNPVYIITAKKQEGNEDSLSKGAAASE